jgi:ribosome recycling factor
MGRADSDRIHPPFSHFEYRILPARRMVNGSPTGPIVCGFGASPQDRSIGMNEKPRMDKAVQHLADQLRGIRSGTISIGLIETVRVPVHGSLVPINRLGTARMQGDRIVIAPFDKANVPAMVKALNDSRLSAYALNPTTVSVSVPPMSGEQREEIARHVKKLGEEAKISIRAIRQQARKQIESSGRGSLKRAQEATDAAVDEIERLIKAKLEELA